MGAFIKCEVKNYKKLQNKLNKAKKASEKVQSSLIGEFKKNAPGYIAKETTKVYSIKPKEIKPNSKGSNKKIGKITVRGKTIATISLVYQGRVLTPTHFGLTPKAPQIGSSYTLKAQFLKSSGKKTLGKVKKLTNKQRKAIAKNFRKKGTQNSVQSPIMLMGTGAKGENKTSRIPFQRVSQDRHDLKAIKTLSMPQMVSNKRVQDGIDKVFSNKIGKRLNHYIDRYMP